MLVNFCDKITNKKLNTLHYSISLPVNDNYNKTDPILYSNMSDSLKKNKPADKVKLIDFKTFMEYDE